MGKRSLRIGLAVLLLLMLGLFVRPVTARAANKLDKPKNLRCEIITDENGSVYDVIWDEVKGAKGYEIRYAENWSKGLPKSEFYTEKMKIREITYKVTATGVTKFQVRAFRKENGKKVYGKWASVKVNAVADQIAVGGWTLNTDVLQTDLNDEELARFEEAMAGFVGVNYEPVDMVAEQVVAGMNYLYLCRATTVYSGAKASWAMVEVYQPLEGVARRENIFDIEEPGSIKTVDSWESLAGGWNATPSNGLTLPKAAQTAFDKAVQ